MHEVTLVPTFAYPLIRCINRLRTQGIEPAAIALPVMPGADPVDQPNATCYGLPVVWMPSDSPEFVMIGLK